MYNVITFLHFVLKYLEFCKESLECFYRHYSYGWVSMYCTVSATTTNSLWSYCVNISHWKIKKNVMLLYYIFTWYYIDPAECGRTMTISSAVIPSTCLFCDQWLEVTGTCSFCIFSIIINIHVKCWILLKKERKKKDDDYKMTDSNISKSG